MLKHITKRFAVAALPLLSSLFLLCTSSARAGVRTVLATDFTPMESDSPIQVNPSFVATASGGAANFWARVKLPVGAKITKLTLMSYGSTSTIRVASLMRTKLGSAEINTDLPGTGTLMQIGDNTTSFSTIDPPAVASTTLPHFQHSDLVVRPGFRYWVQGQAVGLGAAIHAIQVHFKK